LGGPHDTVPSGTDGDREHAFGLESLSWHRGFTALHQAAEKTVSAESMALGPCHLLCTDC